jgi:hypothetical protein
MPALSAMPNAAATAVTAALTPGDSPGGATDERLAAARERSRKSRGMWMSAALLLVFVILVGGVIAIAAGLVRWLSRPLGDGSPDTTVAAKGAGGDANSPPAALEAGKPENKQAIAALQSLGAETSFDAAGNLREVSLADFQFDDEDVQYLRGLPNLRFVILQDANVTDDALANLGKLKSLHALDLTYSGITNHGLRHLTELDRLRYLTLRQTKVTDRSLSYLKSIPSLEVLNLSETATFDDNMREIVELPNLRTLYLNHTSVSNEALKHIAGLPKLREMSLQYTRVTDAGLENLAPLKTLRRLDLRHTEVTPAGAEKLKRSLPRVAIQTELP